MREYYYALRLLLRGRPDLRACLKRCRRCRIFFLTHPRNQKREDLACPFGCQDVRRRECGNARSRTYYGTATGKAKKQRLNSRRRRCGVQPAFDEDVVSEFDARTVGHVRVVVSLIERRRVSLEEIVEMLRRTVRQRSIVRGSRMDYLMRHLQENPP